VPVRRPPDEVRRHKPIEVRRINGIYAFQSNKEEAKAVVDYVAKFWAKHGADPPTAGVVTFNLKQAETIEEALQDRAGQDRAFKTALEREQVRTANGEDVSFFVRNLESVQGDERDIIIFSTTFGKDVLGRFKKTFGVLTQQGGERRLNVAVTRAKSKIVLMTSLPTADVSDFIGGSRGPTKARDYLQAYLRFAEQIHDGEFDAATAQLTAFNGREMPAAPNGPDSDTDALVRTIRSVLEAGDYKTVLMPIDDAFSVDIAVLNSKTGLYSLSSWTGLVITFLTPRRRATSGVRNFSNGPACKCIVYIRRPGRATRRASASACCRPPGIRWKGLRDEPYDDHAVSRP
jgi:primosomal replication protein N''